MKKTILIAAIISAAFCADAQSLKLPAPSPTQTLKQDFALSNIEISYSRPSVKDRTIFGDLVPYGKVWRTGANSATTVTFGDTVTIAGKKINPGKYGLLTIPGQNEWQVIISKSTSTTSPSNYKQDEDVVRATVKPIALNDKVETFTIQVGNIKSTSCDIQLMWDRTMVSLPVTTDIDSRVMSDIDKSVIKDNRPYFQAANYYAENNKDLNKALEWYNKAIENNPKAYWIQYQKANTLAKLGRKKEAVTAAEGSLALAKADGNDDYVKLNEKLIAANK